MKREFLLLDLKRMVIKKIKLLIVLRCVSAVVNAQTAKSVFNLDSNHDGWRGNSGMTDDFTTNMGFMLAESKGLLLNKIKKQLL